MYDIFSQENFFILVLRKPRRSNLSSFMLKNNVNGLNNLEICSKWLIKLENCNIKNFLIALQN